MRKNLGFGILTILLLLVSIVTFVTDASSNEEMFLVKHHTLIMFILIIVSIAFGYYWSTIAYSQFLQQKKDTKHIFDVVMLFLNDEEKSIIHHLVKHNGETTQAEIARLSGMTNVKAYRYVQKMQSKNLIDVKTHGKKREIFLKKNILDVLK